MATGTKVTDPALLQKLNSGTKVTDPSLLSKLNGKTEEKSTLTRDAEVMHSAGADDPNFEYGDILPFKKDRKTGEKSLALPEMIRSPIRGMGDLINQAQNKSTETTPDALAAQMVLHPAAKGASKIAGEIPNAMKFAGRMVEDLKAPTGVPELPSLLEGPGGKKMNIDTKAVSGGRGILHTALKEDDINPLDIAQRLEEAKRTGLPITAADVITKEMGGVQTHGKNVLGLLKGASNMPGPGATMAGEVAARGGKTTERLGKALDLALSKKGVYEVSDEALEKIKTETPKAYKAAFEGGSIAPLEKQFEGELSNVSAEKTSAQQKVNAANQRLLQIEAKKQTNSNVYVDSGLIGEKRKAIEALQKAQQELGKATKKEDSTMDMLRRAKSDRKNGIKGAVWSPRIQEMLADDTVQNGIKKGLWIAKKEALANGEKFNPHEYGITGYDEAGEPIVSKVPNMRMLDAGKKGLDAIINESKNPLTGQMNETGRAVSMLKNAYLKEVDALNPDYAKARQSYGSQASVLEALDEGQNFMRMDKEEISRFMRDTNTSNAEKTAFATGVRRALQNTIDKARDGSNPVNKIWTQYMRDKLEPVFPDKQVFEKFSKIMEHEQSMARTNSALATGSHTNMLGNFQKKISAPGRYVKAITNPSGAAMDQVMGTISNKMQSKADSMSKDQAAIIAKYLTTDDPQLWYDLAQRMQPQE